MIPIPMFDLFVKTPIVFFHFLTAALAIATILRLDIAVLKNYTNPITSELVAQFDTAASLLGKTYIALFVSGLFFVFYGASQDMAYTANEKLWLKAVVVAVIGFNGFLIEYCRCYIQEGVVLSRLTSGSNMLMGLASSISLVSWLWACFLGVARNWNFQVDFLPLLIVYVLSISAFYIPSQLYLFHKRQHQEV